MRFLRNKILIVLDRLSMIISGIPRVFAPLIYLLICSSANGQQYPLTTYNTSLGLSSDRVYRVFRDSNGFLWFCTDYGLSRFDGKFFRNYYTTNGLPNNCIMSVSNTDDGKMLIATNGGGLSVYNGYGFDDIKIKKGRLPRWIEYAYEADSKVWVIGITWNRRLHVIEDGVAREISIRNNVGKEIKFYKIKKVGKRLVFLSDNGLFELAQGNLVPMFKNDSLKERIFDLDSREGNICIGKKDQVICFNKEGVTQKYKVTTKVGISDILIDRSQNIWIGTPDNGIYLIRKGQVLNINKHLESPIFDVNDLLEDNNGMIWIATEGAGVYSLNPVDAVEKITVGGAKSTVVLTSVFNSDTLLLGFPGNVFGFRNGIKFKIPVVNIERNEHLYFVNVIKDTLYIGTPFKLVRKTLNKVNGERVLAAQGGIIGATACLRDSKGTTWVGSFHNLYTVGDNKLTEVSGPSFLRWRRYLKIFQCTDGKLLFGTDLGLISFEKGVFTDYSYGRDKQFAITDINEDYRRRIWLATDNGLYCIDGGVIKHYTMNEGLDNNKCLSLAIDKNRNLWIGTAHGLNVLNVDTPIIKQSPLKIGISMISSIVCSKGGDKLYLGTSNGLIAINLYPSLFAEQAPSVLITNTKVNDNVLVSPDQIAAKWNDKITIEFTSASYFNNQNPEFRYQVPGISKGWHITKNNSLEFPSLPYGEHTFILQARSNKGAWGKPVQLSILIDTPIWAAVWFKLILLIVIVSLIYGLSKFYTLRAQKKKTKRLVILNKVAYLKQQALSALINPHFIFNCMNSISYFLNKKDLDSASVYLADFADLIRMTLDDAQETFLKLDKELIRLNLYLSLEKLRFKKNLEYEFNVSGIDPSNIYVPNMLFQPYVENAIWHGIMPKRGGGKIVIEIKPASSKEISVTIEDNGVGFQTREAKSERKSLGIKLTTDRVALLKLLSNEDYRIDISTLYNSQMPCGTKVIINLPYLTEIPNIDLSQHETNDLV